MATTKTWTMAEIRAKNHAEGWFFFAPSTMKFFASKVYPQVYQGPGGIFFVTSEKTCYGDGLRNFTVRKFDPDCGNCDTADSSFAKKNKACEAAKQLAKGTA